MVITSRDLSCIFSAREWFGQHNFETFYVLAGMGWVWSTQVEIHFVSSLSCAGFGQLKLRYIYVLAGIGGI